jgi:hypothetical protein
MDSRREGATSPARFALLHAHSLCSPLPGRWAALIQGKGEVQTASVACSQAALTKRDCLDSDGRPGPELFTCDSEDCTFAFCAGTQSGSPNSTAMQLGVRSCQCGRAGCIVRRFGSTELDRVIGENASGPWRCFLCAIGRTGAVT